MFFAHGSICSNQSGLYVAEHGVDPFEGGRLCGFRATASFDDSVETPDLGDREETSQSVGSDVGSGRERRAGKLADRDFTERLDAPQDDLIGLAVLGRGDGCDERRLALCAAPASARMSPADIGVVHLHDSLQALARVALQHDLPEFMLHHPGGRLGDAKSAAEFDAGNAFLGLRDVIDRLEPDAQRQFARGENRPSLDGSLLAAGVALEQSPRLARNDAMIVATTIRTFETARPAPCDERRMTLLLGSVAFVEIGFAEAFLELDPIARHRQTPSKTICSCFV